MGFADKNLIVIIGPTGVGKTALSIEIAKHLNTEIISSDSRQMYRGMRIGTAVPSREQLDSVKHHFIHNLDIDDYYCAWDYQEDVLSILSKLFLRNRNVILCGGSMMYIDAVCRGIDYAPTISQNLRNDVMGEYESRGLEHMLDVLRKLDPVFYEKVDKKNPKRVLHAIEVCKSANIPYSELRKSKEHKRDFNILKIGLEMPRNTLYDRINMRVDAMIAEGLEEEVRGLLPMKNHNSLNTVGYKEWFQYFEGKICKEEVVRLIKRNTRHYAKKQMTWFRKYKDIEWFNPSDIDIIKDYISSKIICNYYK